jgi:hypothetical protein
MATVEQPSPGGSADSDELAGFGYKQELDRSLSSFSSFAAGFSYISILTGVFELFGFGFLNAGPGVWWSWLIVLFGQGAVALCFAELAGQFPLAGSVYQWSKRIGTDALSWMTGWILIIGSIVTVAAVAVAWQVVLPQVSTKLQFIGGASSAGTYSTPDGAKNALILGAVLVIFATIINMLGVKVMATLNNIGVIAELIGSTVLVILLIFHFHRGPGVVTHSLGTGAGHSWGYFGLPHRRDHERVRHVWVRHRGHARRGDKRSAPQRPARDPARAHHGGDDRRPADHLLADGGQEHPRHEHRRARPAVHHQAGARQHGRQRLPDRRRARDHRLHARGDDRMYPDAVLDGARRAAALR